MGSNSNPSMNQTLLVDIDVTRPVRLTISSFGSKHRAEAAQAGHKSVGVEVTNLQFPSGFVALGSGYHPISFDNFSVFESIPSMFSDYQDEYQLTAPQIYL